MSYDASYVLYFMDFSTGQDRFILTAALFTLLTELAAASSIVRHPQILRVVALMLQFAIVFCVIVIL